MCSPLRAIVDMRTGDTRLPRIWSPEAKRDLLDIWEFVSLASSNSIADKLLREIEHVCFLTGAFTELGKVRDEIRPGLRSRSVGRYVVFYRIAVGAVEIVRVMDERRDVDSIFSESS